MNIAAAVTFVRNYATLTKSVKCEEISLCAPNMSFLPFSPKNKSINILVIVDTSTKHAQAITVKVY